MSTESVHVKDDNRLYVGNLSHLTDWRDVRDLFESSIPDSVLWVHVFPSVREAVPGQIVLPIFLDPTDWLTPFWDYKFLYIGGILWMERAAFDEREVISDIRTLRMPIEDALLFSLNQVFRGRVRGIQIGPVYKVTRHAYAFVTFKSAELTKKALVLDRTMVNGRTLVVQRPECRGQAGTESAESGDTRVKAS